MKNVSAKLSPGHIVVLVSNVQHSVDFYTHAELPVFDQSQTMAFIELRGGAHIILVQKDFAKKAGLEASRYGQNPAICNETFDLILPTNKKEDLGFYRQRLLNNGIAVSGINEKNHFGHYYFSFNDPDGNGIYVFTSHEIKYFIKDSDFNSGK